MNQHELNTTYQLTKDQQDQVTSINKKIAVMNKLLAIVFVLMLIVSIIWTPKL